MTKRCDECTFFGSVDQYSDRCFRNEFRVSCAGSCPSHVAAVDPAEIIEPDAVAKALEKISQHLEKLEQQHDEMLSMLKATMPKREYAYEREWQIALGGVDPLKTERW